MSGRYAKQKSNILEILFNIFTPPLQIIIHVSSYVCPLSQYILINKQIMFFSINVLKISSKELNE